MYCFVDWEQTPQGLQPALPEGLGCLLLAEPGQYADYALFEVSLSPDDPIFPQAVAVPDPLAGLLDSARQYPPALALARSQVREGVSSRADFAVLLTERLRHYLEAQRESPFFLGCARRSQPGYLDAGTYYWIVGYHPDRVGREVCWVSRDFFVYQDAINDFGIDQEWLAARFLPSAISLAAPKN